MSHSQVYTARLAMKYFWAGRKFPRRSKIAEKHNKKLKVGLTDDGQVETHNDVDDACELLGRSNPKNEEGGVFKYI
jgi:hypothetical protein